MPPFFEWFQTQLDLQVRILVTLFLLALLSLLRLFVNRFISQRLQDAHLRYRWRRTIGYAIVALGFLIIVPLWLDGIESLFTVLGLASAGLVFALRDPLLDLAGWAFILWQKPFNLGDRIEINDMRGDVVDIRLFQFTMLEISNWVNGEQSTGRVIHSPNKLIFTHMVANYTKEFFYIWNELPVLITFESDWQKSKELLQEILEKHTAPLVEDVEQKKHGYQIDEHFLILYSSLSPIIYTQAMESGVELTLRYPCEARNRRTSTHQLWEEILIAFAEHDDLDFAYPTLRYYTAPEE